MIFFEKAACSRILEDSAIKLREWNKDFLIEGTLFKKDNFSICELI